MLEVTLYEHSERIDMLTRQVAELQDGPSGQRGASGQAAEVVSGATPTFHDNGDSGADEARDQAEREARKKKAADLSSAKGELFGCTSPEEGVEDGRGAL